MKILVEGADVAGKTTLIEKLMNELGPSWRYVHHTQNTNSPAEFLATVNSTDNLVIDRLWLSEQIYGHVMRGESNDSDLIVFNRIRNVPHLLVMCVRRDTKAHLEHFARMREIRAEYVEDLAKMSQIISAFRDVTFGNNSCDFPGVVGTLSRLSPLRYRQHCMVHDMDVDTPEFTVRKIKESL